MHSRIFSSSNNPSADRKPLETLFETFFVTVYQYTTVTRHIHFTKLHMTTKFHQLVETITFVNGHFLSINRQVDRPIDCPSNRLTNQ